jgi:uncharacterized protein (TIGR03083 family)
MGTQVDHLSHLAQESARFAAAIRQAPPEAPVPTCPDWNADDLLWHLAKVQYFWGTVVREGLAGDKADELTPERPGDRAGLLAFYEDASGRLARVLAATAPEAAAWTWSLEHTAGFIRRRQAHEALIHRVDAELVTGNRSPIDPLLGADGVDEALRVMYGMVPDWANFAPDHSKTLRLLAADTGHTWFVTLGRFTGTDPDSGTSYDEPDIQAAMADPGQPAGAEVSGDAADLDCWLWRRPSLGHLQRSGDPGILADFEATIGPGIN